MFIICLYDLCVIEVVGLTKYKLFSKYKVYFKI